MELQAWLRKGCIWENRFCYCQLDRRCEDFSNLSFVDLVNNVKFTKYHEHFPEMKLKNLFTLYPNIFYASILKNGFINIYNSDDKILCGPQLLAYIHVKMN